MLKVTVTGSQALVSNLQTLCDELQNSCSRAGIDAACLVIEDAYRTLIPRGKQAKLKPRMKDVVAHKLWKFPDGSGYAGIIGTKSGMAPHAHLVEDGTKYRMRRGKDGKGGIGGRFKFMMKPEFWSNRRVGIRNQFRGKIVKKLGTRPFLLSPGDPETRTGIMPALHPLYIASRVAEPLAITAFESAFSRELNKPVFPNGI